MLLAIVAFPGVSRAISITSFGPSGQAGIAHNRPLQIGPGGEVFALDAFVSVNDSLAWRLSDGALPAGLDLGFLATLSGDGSDLLLAYRFTNVGPSTFTNLHFSTFLDAQIDNALNGYFNEVAIATGSGSPGESFEIDEPGFLFGDIVQNLLANSLDGTNALSPGHPDDVSMAIAIRLGPFAPGAVQTFEVLISEDGDTLGGLTLLHLDAADPFGSTAISFSARAGASVPEPGALILMAIGMMVIAKHGARPRNPETAQ